LRRVAAGKLNLARSYPAPGGARDVSQPEPKAVAGRVRCDETRVSTIEGLRDAAGPHPISAPLISRVPAPTFQQVRERHESMTVRCLRRGRTPTRAAG